MMEMKSKASAFQEWARGARVGVGRPKTMVSALTVGLSHLDSELRQQGETGQPLQLTPSFQSGEQQLDDNNGFLHLPIAGKPADERDKAFRRIGGRYKFKSLLGTGTFAQILEVEDMFSHTEPKKSVALKVLRSGMHTVGQQESELLGILSLSEGFDGANVIKSKTAFTLGGHWCVVMDLMQGSLAEAVKQQKPFTMPMAVMQKLTFQLLVALSFLSKNGIVHADIRAENVLLRSNPKAKVKGGYPCFKVKLGDFGNSFPTVAAHEYFDDFELQTLSYRAPEVMMGLPFDSQIDMWSLGCLLVEVYIGRRLFDFFNRTSAISTMANTLGLFPQHCYCSAKFYPAVASLPVWTDKDLDHPTQKKKLRTLLQCEDAAFIDFIAGLLTYDPALRLTPAAALSHPFVSSLCPLASIFTLGSHIITRKPGNTEFRHAIEPTANVASHSEKASIASSGKDFHSDLPAKKAQIKQEQDQEQVQSLEQEPETSVNVRGRKRNRLKRHEEETEDEDGGTRSPTLTQTSTVKPNPSPQRKSVVVSNRRQLSAYNPLDTATEADKETRAKKSRLETIDTAEQEESIDSSEPRARRKGKVAENSQPESDESRRKSCRSTKGQKPVEWWDAQQQKAVNEQAPQDHTPLGIKPESAVKEISRPKTSTRDGHRKHESGRSGAARHSIVVSGSNSSLFTMKGSQ